MKCFLVIDYQYDFVADDGLLSVGKPAQNIEDFIDKKVSSFLKNDHDVFFTLDTHEKNNWNMHPESKKFPLHCEKQTKGWELYGKLNRYMNNNEKISIIEKSAYSPDFKFINMIVDKYDEIYISGVTTDICVLNTCIVLYNSKINQKSSVKLNIYNSGCATFDESRHNCAIKYILDICGFEEI